MEIALPTRAPAAKKTARPATKAPATKTPATKAPAAKKPAAKAAVTKTAAKPAAKPIAKEAAAKVPKAKAKLVRDSFTMPEADFGLIALMKQRALGFKRPTKKSELLRAGLHALQALDDTRLQKALDALVPLKPGRPKTTA